MSELHDRCAPTLKPRLALLRRQRAGWRDGDGLRGIVVDGTRFDFGDATAFAHTWSKFSEGV